MVNIMRSMQAVIISIICFSLISCSTVDTTSAGGPLISKPEFRGRVVDAESKEPIEGAVVVVMYWKSQIIGGPGGPDDTIVKVKETLTDSNGEFYFPNYTRMLLPLSDDGGTDWIIYKPGYGSYPRFRHLIFPVNLHLYGLEIWFSRNYGIKEEFNKNGKSIIATYGEVELPRLTTRNDRRKSPSIPAELGSKELPLLYYELNKERKKFGLGEVK